MARKPEYRPEELARTHPGLVTMARWQEYRMEAISESDKAERLLREGDKAGCLVTLRHQRSVLRSGMNLAEAIWERAYEAGRESVSPLKLAS
jgi:hypothetical protein